VYEDFTDLTELEQLTLFEAMKKELFSDEPDKNTLLLKAFVRHVLLRVWIAFIVGVHQSNLMVNITHDNGTHLYDCSNPLTI